MSDIIPGVALGVVLAMISWLAGDVLRLHIEVRRLKELERRLKGGE